MTAPRATTLRDQRAGRSLCYSRLQNPIYITQPSILIPLLQGADFDRLPWYYQARTLEESYTGRETPFVWSHIQAEAKRARCLEEQAQCKPTIHRLVTSLPPAKKLRRAGKRIVFFVKREDIHKFGTRRTVPTPLTTSSLGSPIPQPTSVRPKPFNLKIKISAGSFRAKGTGTQVAAGAGLFRDTTRRIRAFQRGGSFVWVIKPLAAVI